MTEQPIDQSSWEEKWDQYEKRKHRSRLWVGLLLLVVGGTLFLKSLNLLLVPGWLFTWPVILMAIGLISGLVERFKGGFWLVCLFIGGIFLANELDPTLRIERFIAPIIIFSIGLLLLLKPRQRRWRQWMHDHRQDFEPHAARIVPGFDKNFASDRRDYVDITSVFGGVKKNILTKNLRGGDVTAFMGGSEINLTQADFSGEIRMDITNIFGGTKLIVPPTWIIHSDIVTIFGGVDDKRQLNGVTADPAKTLILDGTCIFGGIEIRSY